MVENNLVFYSAKPTEGELRGLLEPLLSGLEKVHRAGFLHRDIKPENIYITEDGRPLLLDFGSARQAVTDRSALLTSIVTIGYAPFEQYYEDGKQGPWSDIYALAGVMYRAIHGEKPPEATRRLKNDSSVKLAKRYQRDYTLQFLNAVDRGLSVEAKDRPQTVAAWRSMLGKGAVEKSENLVIPPQPVWQERLRHSPPGIDASARRGQCRRPGRGADGLGNIIRLSSHAQSSTGVTNADCRRSQPRRCPW